MFKETPEGQTHSFNDGCEPPHTMTNQVPEPYQHNTTVDRIIEKWEKLKELPNQVPQEEWEEQFDKQFPQFENYPFAFKAHEPDRLMLKDFIRTTKAQAREQGRREGYMEAVEGIEEIMPSAEGNLQTKNGLYLAIDSIKVKLRKVERIKAKLESKER